MTGEFNIRMRPMNAADLPSVISLERQTYACPWPAFFFRRLWRANAECWVYERNGRIIGYGVLRCVNHWAHIMNMCVARGYRRRGLGRRMLTHLMQLARRSGATHAWLEVKPGNTNAIALYRCLGYRTAGRYKGYYRYGPQRRRDALVMCRRL